MTTLDRDIDRRHDALIRDMAAAAFNAMNLFGVECSAFAPSASAVDQFYKAVVEDLTVHAVDDCDPQRGLVRP